MHHMQILKEWDVSWTEIKWGLNANIVPHIWIYSKLKYWCFKSKCWQGIFHLYISTGCWV